MAASFRLLGGGCWGVVVWFLVGWCDYGNNRFHRQGVFMEINICIGARLREVREALELSQTEFAQIAERAGVPGATRQSQAKYEKGLATPGAAYLAAIAAAGADVLYILTGQRAGGASAPPPPRAVSEGDRILLDNFHAAPAQVQAGVKTALGAFAPKSDARRGKAA